MAVIEIENINDMRVNVECEVIYYFNNKIILNSVHINGIIIQVNCL